MKKKREKNVGERENNKKKKKMAKFTQESVDLVKKFSRV